MLLYIVKVSCYTAAMLVKDVIKQRPIVKGQRINSQSALARVLGISRAAVSQWGGVIPEARQYQLHILSRGGIQAAIRQPRKQV